MATILITGGTGLVGSKLTDILLKNGHQVKILTRNPKQENHYRWDINEWYIDKEAFKDITHIIHLAGAGIADKRWTKQRKSELIDSRVASAKLLFEKVKQFKVPLKGFISASGIGFYGAKTSEKLFTEKDTAANDFIAEICVAWEKAAHQFKILDIPVTILRTGIVLSKSGGALEKMNTPIFLSALGSGKQYMPWIHIEDLCNLYQQAIEDASCSGILNAVAPEYQTNASFTKSLGKVLNKPVLPLNVPSFVLKLALGELSSILLYGSRVSAEKTNKIYNFKFENLSLALKDLFKKS